MPRPQPQEAAPVPTGDFEYLLHELSAEFERLRQQNVDLAWKYAELCAAHAQDNQCVPHCLKGATEVNGHLRGLAIAEPVSPCPKGPAEVKEHDEELAVASIPDRRESDMSQQSVDPSAWMQQSAATSAWRSMVDYKYDRQSGYISGRSHASRRSTWGAKSLEEQFQKLDLAGVGRLYVDDLQRILSVNEEPVEYIGLLNMLRALHDLDPLDIDNDEAGAPDRPEHYSVVQESEALTIDFPRFVQLMEDSVIYDNLTDSAQRCIDGFRKACAAKLLRRGKSKTHIPPPPKKRRFNPPLRRMTAFWLETLPTIVILVNTLVTGISADHPEAEGVWDIFEYIFVTFYFGEFVSKVVMFGFTGYFTGPERWWNLFDFLCLLISLADTTIKVAVEVFWQGESKPNLGALMLIKIFRLARLARLVRTLRFKVFYELKLMVLGVFSGLRVLTWAIVLLVMLIYVFGVAMTNLFGKDQVEFGTVYASMFTLFRCWTEGCAAYDGTPLTERLRASYGPIFMVYHILMTTFVTIGVFNLIMAIFIDNVVTTQMARKHREMGEKTRDIELKFKELFYSFIKNGVRTKRHDVSLYGRACREFEAFSMDEKQVANGQQDYASKVEADWEKLRTMELTITRDVFRAWLLEPDFLKLLDEAEIETANHFELFDVLDADMGGELSMDELTTGLMKLRGPVTKADIVACRLKVRHLTKVVERALVLDDPDYVVNAHSFG